MICVSLFSVFPMLNVADVDNVFLVATTPWIAFVSCDDNSTQASNDTDIFTLAQERGAVAAVSLPRKRFHSLSLNIPDYRKSYFTLSDPTLARLILGTKTRHPSSRLWISLRLNLLI